MRWPIHLLLSLVAAAAGAQQLDEVPDPDGPQVRRGFEELYARQSVEQDDWRSERVAAAIQERLDRWAEAMAAATPELDPLLSDCDDCAIGALAPAGAAVRSGPTLEVRRSGPADLAARPEGRGREALDSRLGELFDEVPDGARRVKFKIFRVTPLDGGAEIDAYVSIYGAADHRSVEIHATWRMGWRLEPSLGLRRLAARRFERIERRGPALLADCTEAVLGANASWGDQLRLPLHHWWRSLDRMSGVTFRGYQGLAVGDVDGDGLDDLYVAQPGGLPDRLFLQRADGTAHDVSAEAGVDYLELTRSALLVDLDNDGDQDLVAVRSAHLVILANDSRGRFRPAAVLPLDGAVMASAADYDGDGDLDLYGVAYRNPDEGLPPTPYHDASNGQPNRLYRNLGELAFEDATSAAGLDVNNDRFSFSAVWEDYDDDGDGDLYVANDFGRNNLYRNDGGRFRDVAATAGVEDISAGMGVTWADVDLDGRMDLYVSNMFSSAGGRVTYQRRFRQGSDDDIELYRRHARGNSLFRNQGDGTFVDVSEEAAVTMGRWAWGAIFADLDNDGRPDIFVPNGFLTNELEDDL